MILGSATEQRRITSPATSVVLAQDRGLNAGEPHDIGRACASFPPASRQPRRPAEHQIHGSSTSLVVRRLMNEARLAALTMSPAFFYGDGAAQAILGRRLQAPAF